MKKNTLKNYFGLKKLSTHDLCILSLLLGISVVMGMLFTFRPTPAIKIPTKFFPIAISATLFGPVWGGLVGFLADVISYTLNPTAGMFMPQISFVEFLYGFSYGLFLKKATKSFNGYVRGITCVLLQIVFLHILLTTYFLIPIMGKNFDVLLISRLPAAGINTALQLAGIIFTVKYSDAFRKLSGGKKV